MSGENPKLKVIINNGEVEIIGNRAGLKDLADTCVGLAELSDEAARTAANHYHFADYMNTAEAGSMPLTLLLKVDL
jgi:hypothetical protein